MQTNAINQRGWPCCWGLWWHRLLALWLLVCVSVELMGLSLSLSLSPCLVVLKLNDWKPPASAEESMTSTPYSLWFFLYSMTATTRIATAMMPAPRPEYRATSLEPSMPEAHKTHGRGTLRSAADKGQGKETKTGQIQYSYTFFTAVALISIKAFVYRSTTANTRRVI